MPIGTRERLRSCTAAQKRVQPGWPMQPMSKRKTAPGKPREPAHDETSCLINDLLAQILFWVKAPRVPALPALHVLEENCVARVVPHAAEAPVVLERAEWVLPVAAESVAQERLAAQVLSFSPAQHSVVRESSEHSFAQAVAQAPPVWKEPAASSPALLPPGRCAVEPRRLVRFSLPAALPRSTPPVRRGFPQPVAWLLQCSPTPAICSWKTNPCRPRPSFACCVWTVVGATCVSLEAVCSSAVAEC